MGAPDHPSRAALWVGLHSLVLGVGWFVVAFGGLMALQLSDALRDELGGLPPAVQGMGAAVLVVVALPLLWPVYIAVGMYEMGLVTRLRAGDQEAGFRAINILRVQSAGLAVVAGMVAALAVWWSDRGGEHLVLAWLPFAVMAFFASAVARAVSHAEP